jgi:asparagine synthase (glutamine-hydrolysing)
MCGIIGAVGKDSYSFIINNLDFLKHRGPDSQGVILLNNHLSLAATRLAMTDPDPRSNQPMTDSMNGNALVFNGEIYNYKEIRKNMVSKGVKFTTESDTEVVLKVLGQLTDDYIKFFQGMFAFCFYNNLNNSITLARDYLGKKPLFYAAGKDFFIFSSKLSLIKNYLKDITLDTEAVSQYLKLGYVISPITMFKDIRSVQPGEVIQIDLQSLQINRKFRFIPDAIINSEDLNLRNTVLNSVRERVTGHDSIALSLSGGIDSTIIAILSAQLGLKCQSYSMHWAESDKSRYNKDSEIAKMVSKKLGIPFTLVNMPSVKLLPEELNSFIKAMEEPNSNPSGLSMMSLYKQISSDGTRLVLTGDGADEVFGGYKRYSNMSRFDWLPMLPQSTLNKLHLNFENKSDLVTKFSLMLSSGQNMDFWYHWHKISSVNYLQKFYDQYSDSSFELSEDYLSKLLSQDKNKVSISMLRDLRIWLTMESNTKLDRVSMAHSIEARSPFQSERLIGLGYRKMLENDFKVLNKRILIDQFPELKKLPINSTKMGFISPLGYWLRNNPELVFDSVKYLKLNFNFNKDELDLLSISPRNNRYSEFNFLWSLIVLAKWHESEFN